MKKKELRALADMSDQNIIICNVLERQQGRIRFVVDEGLTPPKEHLKKVSAQNIVSNILEDEQIELQLRNLVACGFDDSQLSYVGEDVLFQTILTCYASHRPLVLSPDMIWLLIAQTIARFIRFYSDRFRRQLVDFQGVRDLTIKSKTDLFDSNTDWPLLLRGLYNEIEANTKAGIANAMQCDFTTTQDDEYIASIATLMGAVEAYFHYNIIHFICGIPEITLLGTVSDWNRVYEKAKILKSIRLQSWYGWIEPILREFVRTDQGKPNLAFWKNIVLQVRYENFDKGTGCLPDSRYVDGWCVALFPFRNGKSRNCSKTRKTTRMDSEMMRVAFQYIRVFSTGQVESFPMELWSGFIGVEENPLTFELTPKIGWFVRQSDLEAENLARLKAQDNDRGIILKVDKVPEILRQIPRIQRLTLLFEGDVHLPEWLLEKDIETLEAYGKIDKEKKASLESLYPNLHIAFMDNPDYEF